MPIGLHGLGAYRPIGVQGQLDPTSQPIPEGLAELLAKERESASAKKPASGDSPAAPQAQGASFKTVDLPRYQPDPQALARLQGASANMTGGDSPAAALAETVAAPKAHLENFLQWWGGQTAPQESAQRQLQGASANMTGGDSPVKAQTAQIENFPKRQLNPEETLNMTGGDSLAKAQAVPRVQIENFPKRDSSEISSPLLSALNPGHWDYGRRTRELAAQLGGIEIRPDAYGIPTVGVPPWAMQEAGKLMATGLENEQQNFRLTTEQKNALEGRKSAEQIARENRQAASEEFRMREMGMDKRSQAERAASLELEKLRGKTQKEIAEISVKEEKLKRIAEAKARGLIDIEMQADKEGLRGQQRDDYIKVKRGQLEGVITDSYGVPGGVGVQTPQGPAPGVAVPPPGAKQPQATELPVLSTDPIMKEIIGQLGPETEGVKLDKLTTILRKRKDQQQELTPAQKSYLLDHLVSRAGGGEKLFKQLADGLHSRMGILGKPSVRVPGAGGQELKYTPATRTGFHDNNDVRNWSLPARAFATLDEGLSAIGLGNITGNLEFPGTETVGGFKTSHNYKFHSPEYGQRLGSPTGQRGEYEQDLAPLSELLFMLHGRKKP